MTGRRPNKEVLAKIRELQDQYLYLSRNGKNPITADELKLKAQALRWTLGNDTL